MNDNFDENFDEIKAMLYQEEAEAPADFIPVPVVPEPVVAAVDTQPKRRSGIADAYDYLQCIVVAIVGVILFFTFGVRNIEVVGSSMLPTLHDADRITLSGLFYNPKVGDIVVLRKESFRSDPVIKRVVAVAGQTIDIDFTSGTVTVDGVERDEPFIRERTHRPLDFAGPQTVPEGCIFVMGDNRNESNDSRDANLGMVDTRLVMGRLLFRVLPISKFGKVDK